jgi:pimeloyl-ACP methyl ester carboxylesterase
VDVSVPPWDIYPLTHIEEYKPEEVLSMLPKYFQNVLFEKGRRTKRFLASMKRLGEKTSLLSDVEAENEIPDAKLKQIRCPTLCLYGNNSVCLPIGEHLARAIPNARLETVPGIHYLLSDESAVFVSERVEQFFRE